MGTFDANSWVDYSTYVANKRRREAQLEKGIKLKKELEKRLQDRDATVKGVAYHCAEEMQEAPSELEKRMKDFLDRNNIKYNFQRVFFIKNRKRHIEKFYIADFYIPAKSTILETDGAFHDKQLKEDAYRTRSIQKHYPNIKVIRWRWHDFDSYSKMRELLSKLK